MIRPTVRAVTAATLVTAGAALGLVAVTPAFAHDTGTRQVAWLVTSGSFDNRFGTPQTLYTGDLTCGTGLIQYDTYDTSTPEHAALVQALIDGGTLTSGQDTPVYLSNTDLELTPCVTPTATTPATTTPTTTSPPVTEPTVAPTPTSTPTQTPPTGQPTSPAATPTNTPTTAPTSMPTVTPTTPPTAPPTAPQTAPATSPTTAATSPSPSPTSTPSQPSTPGGHDTGNSERRLAYTGSPNPAPLLGIAALTTISGAVMLAWKRRKNA